MNVQALVPEAPVEALYVTVFRGLSGMGEVKLDTSVPGPGLKGFGRELRTMVDRNRDGRAMSRGLGLEHVAQNITQERAVFLR